MKVVITRYGKDAGSTKEGHIVWAFCRYRGNLLEWSLQREDGKQQRWAHQAERSACAKICMRCEKHPLYFGGTAHYVDFLSVVDSPEQQDMKWEIRNDQIIQSMEAMLKMLAIILKVMECRWWILKWIETWWDFHFIKITLESVERIEQVGCTKGEWVFPVRAERATTKIPHLEWRGVSDMYFRR